DDRKKCPLHLTYSAFCLAARVRTTCFLKLTPSGKSSNCFCPVKQKRALLKSNPPRDNWTESDEIIRLHMWGAKNSPHDSLETFISEPSYALENLEYPARSESNSTEQTNKNTLSRCPFFRGKRKSACVTNPTGKDHQPYLVETPAAEKRDNEGRPNMNNRCEPLIV